jgi:plastocyanin
MAWQINTSHRLSWTGRVGIRRETRVALRKRTVQSRWHVAAVTAAALAVLLALSGDPKAATAQAVSNQVNITAAGFVPSSSAIGAGDNVHWTNQSGVAQSVTADDGLFDSGPIPPGGGFSIAIAVPGDHAYHSTPNPSFSGMVRVVVAGLTGPAGDLANGHVPAIDFPLTVAADIGVHPTSGAEMSPTHIIVGFTPTATVAQANAALLTAHVAIMGGLPRLGLLLVAVPATADFSTLDAAITSLRADPAVELAARSEKVSVETVPQATESGIAAPRPSGLDWNWSLSSLGASTPFGEGGNWGLKASRFPQAWNLLETIRRKNPQIETGIVDVGFQFGHSDLSVLQPETLCTPVQHKCIENTSLDHGNHVAGIIGADFDNSLDATHSRGVSGANPVAHMHGTSLFFSGDSPSISLLVERIPDVFDLILTNQEPGISANWRVINFSMGMHVVDLPANDVEANGRIARKVAERAAKDHVMIVQSAGNDSTSTTPVPAQRAGLFKWAAANWVSSDPNPILVVEAIGNDRDPGVYPPGWLPQSLRRAGFSNDSGDISAPGVLVASTASTVGTGCLDANKDSTVVTASGAAYCAMSGTSMAAPFVTGLIGYLLAYNSDLSIPQLRSAVLIHAAKDTIGAAPRLDAFASLLSLPGAAKNLVDVNDYSPDGNHRQKLGPDGANLGPDTQFTHDNSSSPDGRPYYTDPDGKVDMRDFRRFRDAFFATCMESFVQTGTSPDGCPDHPSIDLNGGPSHPKKDLNFDGCVSVGESTCPTSETVYSRFDFNGDGLVSRTTTALVPLNRDGTPSDSHSPMTDLQVLESQWGLNTGELAGGPRTADTEGWTADKLSGLMESGDLEIHADDFFASPNVTDVDVSVRRLDTSNVLPPRKDQPPDGWHRRGSVYRGHGTGRPVYDQARSTRFRTGWWYAARVAAADGDARPRPGQATGLLRNSSHAAERSQLAARRQQGYGHPHCHLAGLRHGHPCQGPAAELHRLANWADARRAGAADRHHRRSGQCHCHSHRGQRDRRRPDHRIR